MNLTPAFTQSCTTFLRCLLTVLFLLSLMTVASGTTTTSASDGSTPVGSAPGAPSGSYALSGLDNINLYSGNLNFRLPLLRIGGRGEAQYTIMLPIEAHWRVLDRSNDYQEILLPQDSTWSDYRPGYGPGVFLGRQGTLGTCNPNVQGTQYTSTLTRLTFILPDGTEYELRPKSIAVC